MKPKLSIIVPIYKVEAYLHRCVDSILSQSYPHLEIILVDDGSPDNCGSICDEYARLDARVKVIHKPNGGQANARNAGLAAASGEYITFVDSDDWIHQELYERAMARAPFSLMLFGCTDVDAKTGEMTVNQLSGTDKLVWKDHADLVHELVSRSLFGYSANKIYHRDIIAGLSFEHVLLREDLLFSQQACARTHQIDILEFPGYYYYHHANSHLNGRYCGPVPNIAQTALYFTTLHPDLDARTNKKICNEVMKTYILDAFHKFVFHNIQLTAKERFAAVGTVIRNPQLRRELSFQHGESSLYRLLTLSVKLCCPSLLYIFLKRIWHI